MIDLLVGAWPDVIAGLILAMIAYASTNVDNLLLVTSTASRAGSRRPVVYGFLLASVGVLSVSVAFTATAELFAPRALGLLGFVPIVVGLKILLNLHKAQENETMADVGALSVALVLLANSSDTIAVLGPLLAESEPVALFSMLAGYIVMAGIWLTLAIYLSERVAQMGMVMRAAKWATPIIMIAFGIYILLDTTTDTVVTIP